MYRFNDSIPVVFKDDSPVQVKAAMKELVK
jgi:hypothetical protein